MTATKKPEPSNETRWFATYIAMVVRNAMEDFHCEHLSDEQMKELNTIIRNAVCTAVPAFETYERSDCARRFVDHHIRMVPSYWERPEFLGGYLQMLSDGGTR